MSESLGLTSHKSSCNCTGCGMLRAGVCINCAEKTAALILESGPGEIAVEPCSGACRELSCTSPPRQSAGARRSHDEPLHDPPPAPSKHLTRCLRNRVQAMERNSTTS